MLREHVSSRGETSAGELWRSFSASIGPKFTGVAMKIESINCYELGIRLGQAVRLHAYADKYESRACDQAIHIALEDLFRYIKRKSDEMAVASGVLKRTSGLNYRQQALLQHALKKPDAVITIETHRRSHNVVRATAVADLNDLVGRGYLNRNKVGRMFYYMVPVDLSKRLESNDN